MVHPFAEGQCGIDRDLDMELQAGDAIAKDKRLVAASITLRDATGARRQFKRIAVPMEDHALLRERIEWRLAIDESHGKPADLLHRILHDLAAENIRDQLRAEA